MVALMPRSFCHLSNASRTTIEALRAQGRSMRFIASSLNVSPSTISREISRSGGKAADWYLAVHGQRARQRARSDAGFARRKLGPDVSSVAWRHVLAGLRVGWSPEQIAGRLKATSSGCMPAHAVSHETIYSAIYAMPRGALRTELVTLLRHSHAGRLPRARGSARFTGVQDMTPISLRPPEVCARIVPGHWEGDLIKGAANRSAVGTLVERTSRFVMLAKLDSASATSVLAGFTRRLGSVPESLRKTLTYDQGTEMALHQTLAKRLRIDIFFCDPHSPWQRGSNENANGLIREFLPKGTDLSQHSHQALAAIESSLNNRPRKILSYRTPAEVFDELRLDQVQGVALRA
jgi:IS30 family transposase